MNPIIFLWAHPRSMSTAIERVMRERGDFDCLHEPFLRYYYLQRVNKPLPHFDNEQEHPLTYADTRDLILERAEKAPLFVKDMSYYVMPEILQDREFCQRIRHCFLIRNPLHAILSYYRLDADVTLSEIGIEMQWRHFEGLQRLGIDDNLVLEAEAVQADSVSCMRQFWSALGLEDRQHALCWDKTTSPDDWRYVQGWHQSVTESSEIRRILPTEEQSKTADFERLCQSAPQLQSYLEHHQLFYHKLRKHSLTSLAHGH